MLMRGVLSACVLMNPVFVLAGALSGSVRPEAKTLGYSDVLNWTGSLLAVLAIFFLCIWVIRKSGKLSASGREGLSVMTAISLGMREKVVLVKVGDKQLLLGVTPGKIVKLLELEGEEKLFEEQESHTGSEFTKKLIQAMKGQPDE